MEPVQGSTSGHMQLEYMKPLVDTMPVHVLVDHLLQVLWALTTTVSREIVLIIIYPLSTLMTHCGMDKIVHGGLERTCCDPPNLPWFCKELPQSTTDNLELRICGDENLSNEDITIDLVQLYIQ